MDALSAHPPIVWCACSPRTKEVAMTLSTSTQILRSADTSAPILGILADRWSPRSYNTAAVIPEETLTAVLEAARWSPSASNSQPWRFIVGRRGTPTFDAIAANLMGFNQAWAPNASVLIVNVAETTDPDGNARPWAAYDLGQAVAHLSVQAQHEGLHLHQLGGIVAEGLRDAFDIDANFTALTVTALGVLDTPEALGVDALIEREIAPRERLALADILLVNE